ncbi:MAG: hypothetical protein QXS68_03095 [Candidatus Methanomethylicaceae archaeon]
MATYKFASGWNNQAGLSDLVIQPRSENISWPSVRTAANGLTYFDGMPKVELLFSVLTKSEFDSLISQLGFSDSTKSVKATMRFPRNKDRSAGTYNVIIDYPNMSATKYQYFWREVRLSVRIVSGLNTGDLT